MTNTTNHTIGEMAAVFSELLQYVREDAEVHLLIDHDEDDVLCPVRLYERARAVHENAGLWALLQAAPKRLEVLRDARDSIADFYEVDHEAAGQHFGLALLERIEAALGNSGNEEFSPEHP